MDFKSEYLGQFVNPKYSIAEQLWIQYYYLTEEYDLSVCSGISPMDGGAIPQTSWERKRINQNAIVLKEHLARLKKYYGIPNDEWDRAKYKIASYKHSYITDLYNQLDYKDLTQV